jgi:transcriptional regulator with XRE-family HTH domain
MQVKRFRERAGLTQAQLAERLMLKSQSTVSLMESGRTKLTRRNEVALAQIARDLNVPLTEADRRIKCNSSKRTPRHAR